MKDSRKTKMQLLGELAEYRQRVTELEAIELERTQAEQALRRSEAKLRALFAAMTDVILALDKQGRCLEIAPTSPNLLYKPTDDLLGKTVHEVLPASQADFVLDHVRRTLETQQTTQMECTPQIGDNEIWFDALLSPLSSDTVIVVARDITARKQAEADLRAQEQLLENLVAVARATNERPMLLDTLQNALDIAMALTGAPDGELIMLDGSGRVTHSILPAGPATPEERENYIARVMERGLPGWVARHRQAALVPDTLSDERWLMMPDARRQFRSALCMPIENESALSGILTLVHPCVAHFTPQHLHLIQAAADEIALAVRNAEIFEGQRRRAEREFTLYEVLRAVSRLQDPSKVAQKAIDAIVQFAGWPQAAIIVPNEESTHWVVSAASGYLASAAGTTRPIEQGVVGRALRTGQTQNVSDVSADPDYIAGHPRTRSELIVLLQRGQATCGALSLDSDRVAGFDSDDVVLAESLAEAIALALENARLYAQMQQHAADMATLYAITRITSRSLALEEVIEQSLSSAISLLGFSGGLIALAASDDLDHEPNVLQLVAARGLPADLVEHFRHMGMQGTLTAYVHHHRKSLVIQDCQREVPPEVGPAADLMIGQGYRAFAGIPLLHQGQSLGAISLVAREPRSSSAFDQALLGAIGQQIAGAVTNAQWFQAALVGRSRLQALINSSRDGIILVGTDGRILIMNAPALKLLRLPGQPQEWQERSLRDALILLRIFAPMALRAAMAEVRRVRRGNAPLGEGEVQVPPHTVRWVSLPVMTGTRPQGQLIVLYDVTDERSVERLREDMTHTMVHDLRNPLGSIYSALEMVTEGTLGDVPPDQLEVLQVAQQSAQRMLELVNAILDVSRLESGRMPLEQRAFSLTDLVSKSLKAQTALADNKNIRLESSALSELPQAWADADIIARVLQNLIGNAIKFTPAGGIVSVTSRCEEQARCTKLLVQVSDTGPGIPPEIQSRLFQKFVSGRQEERGSGLGLAFCKLALEAHGERIWVESTPGQGAAFSFSLAIAPSTA
jgi:PAS domain S-box-containing protein